MWLFIILFLSLSTFYLLAGSFYNFKFRDMHGMHVIPQWQVTVRQSNSSTSIAWRSLPYGRRCCRCRHVPTLPIASARAGPRPPIPLHSRCILAAFSLLETPSDSGPPWGFLQYWQQIPGLVKEGCIFSYKKSIWCYHTSKRKWRECKEGQGTEELRAPIAAAKDDDED